MQSVWLTLPFKFDLSSVTCGWVWVCSLSLCSLTWVVFPCICVCVRESVGKFVCTTYERVCHDVLCICVCVCVTRDSDNDINYHIMVVYMHLSLSIGIISKRFQLRTTNFAVYFRFSLAHVHWPFNQISSKTLWLFAWDVVHWFRRFLCPLSIIFSLSISQFIHLFIPYQ